MNMTEYTERIDNQINKCRDLLVSKNAEYNKENVNPFHNFEVGAALTGKPARQILGGYMLKHTVSIYNMIFSDDDYNKKKWEEKITDHINYLLILKALITRDKYEISSPDKKIAAENISDIKSAEDDYNRITLYHDGIKE